MRFLIASDFVRDESAGAAGSILDIGRALADRGHEIDYLWKDETPYKLPHGSLSRWLELPRRQYRQIAAQMTRAPYDVVIIGQPYAYLAYERLPAKYPVTHAAGRQRLVEIGCWHGVNTRRLRRVMASDGIVFGVDPYTPGRLGFSTTRIIARHEVDKEANGVIRWIRSTDVEAARWFAESRQAPFDFVFSDSLNTYEGFAATWQAWSPLAGAGARYVLANSRSCEAMPIEGAGSVAFTRDVIMQDPRFRLVETVDTFTVLERR